MNKVIRNKNPKALKKAYKYKRISGCWNCNLHGHTFKNCRFPKLLRCSFCRTPKVKTINCSCRKNALQNLITKKSCEPLRILNGIMVIDITICIDNFEAEVNTSSPTTKIHRNLANYAKLTGVEPRSDNTIDVDVNVQGKKTKLNCVICEDSNFAISLGLPDLLRMGFRFGHESTFIRQQNYVPIKPTENIVIQFSNDNYQEPVEKKDEDVLSITWEEELAFE